MQITNSKPFSAQLQVKLSLHLSEIIYAYLYIYIYLSIYLYHSYLLCTLFLIYKLASQV